MINRGNAGVPEDSVRGQMQNDISHEARSKGLLVHKGQQPTKVVIITPVLVICLLVYLKQSIRLRKCPGKCLEQFY
jgi:hypothetical protein